MQNKLIKHFSALVEIDIHTLDIREKSFIPADTTFCSRCPKHCDYKNMHFYGCCESVRWDNKYIYYCPMDFIFIAVPIVGDYDTLESGVILGPILMGDPSDFEQTFGVTQMSTSRVNHLAEIASAVFSNRRRRETVTDTTEFLNGIYRELELLPKSNGYPIELEKELQSAIVAGDEAMAREYLNRLLGETFFRSNANPKVIKARALELLVLLSRSAIEGGADVAQIFALNNNYIQEIDQFDSTEKLGIWLTNIINRFISYMFVFGDIRHSVTLHKVIGYIRTNYMKKLTLDEIANQVYMSKSHVSKIFNEEMNISISAFINKIRIEKSKQLLLDATLSVADVAHMTGFGDQSYFAKQFKAETGASPKEFRDKIAFSQER
ncbi:MAG: AraC family transcriptional regulator [Clostridia bacterium]|nr:AraC family transcriptional regulator [Clostridia bacterium]